MDGEEGTQTTGGGEGSLEGSVYHPMSHGVPLRLLQQGENTNHHYSCHAV